MPLARAPPMPEERVPASAAAAAEKNDVISFDDVQALLADLNIDSLMAGLDGGAATEPAAAQEPTPAQEVGAATPSADTLATEERRTARRLQMCELSGEIRLTIPGCSDIQIINISGNGVLVETARQLRPDTLTDLFVRLNGKRHAMKARTIRSTVHSVRPETGILYRTALHFDKELPVEGH